MCSLLDVSEPQHVSNVGYYSIPGSHNNNNNSSRTVTRRRVTQSQSPQRTDPTKYQSPFVRRDPKRITSRSRSRDRYQPLVTQHNKAQPVLAQAR